jgi:hypothetical protein
MNVEYCTQCGHKNVYSATPPNFCGGCGTPFNKQVGVDRSINAVAEETLAEEREAIPDLTKIAYEVEMDNGNRKITLGEVMREGVRTYGENGPPKETTSIPGRETSHEKFSSKEDLLKDGLNSCKSSRGQPSQEIEEK